MIFVSLYTSEVMNCGRYGCCTAPQKPWSLQQKPRTRTDKSSWNHLTIPYSIVLLLGKQRHKLAQRNANTRSRSPRHLQTRRQACMHDQHCCQIYMLFDSRILCYCCHGNGEHSMHAPLTSSQKAVRTEINSIYSSISLVLSRPYLCPQYQRVIPLILW